MKLTLRPLLEDYVTVHRMYMMNRILPGDNKWIIRLAWPPPGNFYRWKKL